MQSKAEYWIEGLQLMKHPEGGYFRETYRSQEKISAAALDKRYGSERSVSTSIYFLLKKGEFSAFHRIQSDELWHFYTGAPLTVYLLTSQGKLEKHLLGPDMAGGQFFQMVIGRGTWFAAEIALDFEENSKDYTLVGCTVAPGFDFKDFELAQAQDLIKQYPQHKELIARMTVKGN